MATIRTTLPLADPVGCDCASCRFAAVLESSAVLMYSAMGLEPGEAAGGLGKLGARLLLVQAFQEKHGPIEKFTEAEAVNRMTADIIARALKLCDELHVLSRRQLQLSLVKLAAEDSLKDMPTKTRTM